MPSYLSYKAKMAVLDAKNDDVKAWITVNGNHIPIMKGQSKEDAVKSFIASKSDKASAKRESKPTSAGEATKKVVEQTKKNQEMYKEHKKQETAKKIDKKLAERSNKPEHISEATKRVEKNIKGERVELTDLQGNKYTTTKRELEEAGTSKFGLDPKGIKPAILEPKKEETKKFEIRLSEEDIKKWKSPEHIAKGKEKVMNYQPFSLIDAGDFRSDVKQDYGENSEEYKYADKKYKEWEEKENKKFEKSDKKRLSEIQKKYNAYAKKHGIAGRSPTDKEVREFIKSLI